MVADHFVGCNDMNGNSMTAQDLASRESTGVPLYPFLYPASSKTVPKRSKRVTKIGNFLRLDH